MGPAFATTMGGLLTCVAQQICVNIEFNGEYQVTHTHSNYKHEPEELPSSKLIFKLNDLNADESRNLLFQLYVPKEHAATEQFVVMNEMPKDQVQENPLVVNTHVIGKYIIITDFSNDLVLYSLFFIFKRMKAKSSLHIFAATYFIVEMRKYSLFVLNLIIRARSDIFLLVFICLPENSIIFCHIK